MKAYKTDTLTQHCRTYLIEWFYDDTGKAPWDNGDCHGPVSGWERRSKRPGERILNSDRGSHRFYDFQQAVKDAVKVWGCKPGPDVVEAVERHFEYLRRWCADQWFYCGIRVTLLDDEGEKTDIDAVCWGIESDADGYHASVIQDLIGNCDYLEARTVYPVTQSGV
jgi:hypothetical protein